MDFASIEELLGTFGHRDFIFFFKFNLFLDKSSNLSHKYRSKAHQELVWVGGLSQFGHWLGSVFCYGICYPI